MAEPSVEQKPEMDVLGSPTQKRKRGLEPGSPDTRRSKRGTSAAAVAIPVMQQQQQQQQPPQQSPPQQQQPLEAAATAFMEESSQMPTTTAAGGQQEQSDGGLIPAEFSVIDAATAAAAAGVANSGSVDHGDAAAAANAAALASSTAAAALGSLFPTIHVPQPTEETFANQQVDGGEHQHMSPQQQLQQQQQQQLQQQQQQQQAQLQHQHGGDASAYGQVGDVSGTPDGLSALEASDAVNGVMGKRSGSTFNAKPAVGTDEWHKIRKDNHKEVERRRRETINEGINELAKIVPGCEKNKGSILQRAVMFITQLKENETQNIEKWTLEKLLTEQAIAELSASNDKLKAEVDRLYREVETWKSLAQSAGLQPVEEKTEPAS